jgi:excisionase family DNA binding protein
MNPTTSTATPPLLLDAAGDLPTLALRPREAAKALGVSERTLWQLTKDHKIPHVRLGRAIIYSVEGLRGWLKAQELQP